LKKTGLRLALKTGRAQVIYCAARAETRRGKSGLVFLLAVTSRQAARNTVQLKKQNEKFK
jgi:hypothetical protein